MSQSYFWNIRLRSALYQVKQIRALTSFMNASLPGMQWMFPLLSQMYVFEAYFKKYKKDLNIRPSQLKQKPRPSPKNMKKCKRNRLRCCKSFILSLNCQIFIKKLRIQVFGTKAKKSFWYAYKNSSQTFEDIILTSLHKTATWVKNYQKLCDVIYGRTYFHILRNACVFEPRVDWSFELIVDRVRKTSGNWVDWQHQND